MLTIQRVELKIFSENNGRKFEANINRLYYIIFKMELQDFFLLIKILLSTSFKDDPHTSKNSYCIMQGICQGHDDNL
jgi:hypothetical protein